MFLYHNYKEEIKEIIGPEDFKEPEACLNLNNIHFMLKSEKLDPVPKKDLIVKPIFERCWVETKTDDKKFSGVLGGYLEEVYHNNKNVINLHCFLQSDEFIPSLEWGHFVYLGEVAMFFSDTGKLLEDDTRMYTSPNKKILKGIKEEWQYLAHVTLKQNIAALLKVTIEAMHYLHVPTIELVTNNYNKSTYSKEVRRTPLKIKDQYKVLKLENILRKVINPKTGKTKFKMPFHLCRGHYKTYYPGNLPKGWKEPEDGKPFRVWTKAHFRGSKKHGTLTKDYAI